MSDLQSKTDEELNVMLAELMGWVFNRKNPGYLAIIGPDGNYQGGASDYDPEQLKTAMGNAHVPRYCASLDEVARVEKERIIAPFSDESNDYMDGAEANYNRLELYRAYLNEQLPEMGEIWAANARQRTIALIATLTKQPAEPSK